MAIKLIVDKILVYMENSVFFRGVTWFLELLGRMFSGSIVIRSISKAQDRKWIEQSAVYGGIAWLFTTLQKLGEVKPLKSLAASPVGRLIDALPFWGILAIVGLTPFLPTMLTAALMIAVTFCFILKCMLNKNFKFPLDLMGCWILIFILITLFKGATSLAFSSSLKIALLTTLFMLFYFLLTSIIDSRQKLEYVLILFCTAALVAGLQGISQWFSGLVDTTWVDKSLFQDVKLRVFSTFDNPNVYGEYLLIAIPVCLISGVVLKNTFLKIYCFGASVLLLVNLALTYSRGCYLALALAVLVFIMFMEKRLIVLFSAGIFVLPLILPASMINRVLSITNLSDSSTSYRLSIWIASVRLLQDFWVSGVGQGIDAYNAVYPFYSFSNVKAPHAHNLFLQTFIETGIIGIVAFLAIIFCFFKTLVPFFSQTRNIGQKIFAAGFMAMMCGFLLQSFFDYSFYNYKVYVTFFTALAIASAYVRLESVPCGEE